MPFDGSGNYTRVHDWTDDRDAAIKIQASRMDAEHDDVASALNQVMLRTGVAAMTGDLDMGTNSIKSIASGTAASPSIRFNADATTGVYLAASGRLGIAANGVERLHVDTAGANVTGTLEATGATTLNSTLAVTGVATFTAVPVFSAGLGAVSGTTGTFSSTLAVTGNATFAADVMVGSATAPDTTLNVQTSSNGRLWSPAGDLIIERSGSPGLTLAASATGTSSIRFGDVADEDAGGIFYNHSADEFTFRIAAGTRGTWTATEMTFDDNLSVGGTLGVTGVATFTAVPVFSAGLGAVSGTTGAFSSNVTVGGTLGVTGNSTLTGTLDVNNSTRIATSSSTSAYGQLSFGRSGATTGSHIIGTTAGDIQFRSGDPLAGSSTTHIIIDSSGLVGIGVTPASGYNLDVLDVIRIQGTSPILYIKETDTSAQHRILSAGGSLYIQAQDSDATSDGDMYLTGYSGADANLIQLETANFDVQVGGTSKLSVDSDGITLGGGVTEKTYSLTGTAINPANGTIQYKTQTGNTTFTESLANGDSVTLMLDSGGFTTTWPTITWVGGSAPTIANGSYSIIVIFQVNGVLYGAYQGDA